MTPFGEHMRKMRAERGVAQNDMARAIGVSPAYLSALEHGKRGTPSYALLQRIVGFFNVIWDDAEKLQALAQMSDPRVVVETAALSANATYTANLFAREIDKLSESELNELQKIILSKQRL